MSSHPTTIEMTIYFTAMETTLHSDEDDPPPNNDGDNPPLHSDEDDPPPHNDGDEPPLHGDGDNPPLHGDEDNPPPITVGYDTPPITVADDTPPITVGTSNNNGGDNLSLNSHDPSINAGRTRRRRKRDTESLLDSMHQGFLALGRSKRNSNLNATRILHKLKLSEMTNTSNTFVQ